MYHHAWSRSPPAAPLDRPWEGGGSPPQFLQRSQMTGCNRPGPAVQTLINPQGKKNAPEAGMDKSSFAKRRKIALPWQRPKHGLRYPMFYRNASEANCAL